MPNLPNFLEHDMAPTDIIIAGTNINFWCPEGKMLPEEVDQDSNFALEVYCIDGEFQAPAWPSECVDEVVCTTIPIPPTGGNHSIPFERADNQTKYRLVLLYLT